jgi:hypothetical protein
VKAERMFAIGQVVREATGWMSGRCSERRWDVSRGMLNLDVELSGGNGRFDGRPLGLFQSHIPSPEFREIFKEMHITMKFYI